MVVLDTAFEGVYLIEPQVFKDARGYFFESFSSRKFYKQVAPVEFVQDNESASVYGVVRGLHFQKSPYAQSKLVRVVRGEVLDVIVDLRKDSSTFGKWASFRLSAENKRQLFIPKGFAHGFSVLSQAVVFQYKCDAYYHPEAEGAIAWNDPELGIDWGIPAEDAIVSAKDSAHPRLSEIVSPF